MNRLLTTVYVLFLPRSCQAALRAQLVAAAASAMEVDSDDAAAVGDGDLEDATATAAATEEQKDTAPMEVEPVKKGGKPLASAHVPRKAAAVAAPSVPAVSQKKSTYQLISAALKGDVKSKKVLL